MTDGRRQSETCRIYDVEGCETLNDEFATTPGPPRPRVVEIETAIRSVAAFGELLVERGQEPDPNWHLQLAQAQARLAEDPSVQIALLGGTGAGKSTLVNAMAECRLLPVSSMKACTSAITEVSYKPGGYEATVEFVSRDSWFEELQHLEQDLADEDFRSGDEISRSITYTAESKLDAVYGPESKARYLVSLDRNELEEPDEVAAAFDAGSITLASDDVADFRTELKQYLDSDHRYWPIVKRVSVRGPFRRIGNGMTLVDLPGLNDPNPAREEATREHLKNARFVWVVFNMKRALTKDVFDFLRDGDLLRRLFVDGYTGSLMLVGTGSDEIDYDSDIEKFGLDGDAEVIEVIRARSAEVKQVVRSQLDELAMLLAHDASADPAAVAMLRQELATAPIHTVTAKEYLKCRGLMKKVSPVVAVEAETGLPALQDEAAALVSEVGERVHFDRILQQVEAVRLSMEGVVESHYGALAAADAASGAQLKEVRSAADRLRGFLEQETAATNSDLSIKVRLNDLDVELDAGVVASAKAINELRATLQNVHWSTMRAAARRSGVFASPASGKVDLSKTVSKPFLDSTSFAWVGFFGTEVTSDVSSFGSELLELKSRHSTDLMNDCRRISPELSSVVESHVRPSSEKNTKVVAKRVETLENSIENRLRNDRKLLDTAVESAVGEKMEPAFLKAGTERGSGTKARMIDGIVRAATEVVASALSDARQEIRSSLNDLVQFVEKEAAETRGQLLSGATQVREVVANELAEQLDEDALRRAVDGLDELLGLLPEPLVAAASEPV